MSKVKETQSLVSAAVDPLIGMLGGMVGTGSLRSSQTRSRSRYVVVIFVPRFFVQRFTTSASLYQTHDIYAIVPKHTELY